MRDPPNNEPNMPPSSVSLLARVEARAAVRIQRAWRTCGRLALVAMNVHDDDPYIQSCHVYYTTVRACSTMGATRMAAKSASSVSCSNEESRRGDPCFICWINDLNLGAWHHMSCANGNTFGVGLAGSLSSTHYY